MKLAFSTIGCPEWNWDDALSAASDLGYDGVEIRGVSNELFAPAIPEFTAGKLAETKARLGSLRLAIPCLTSACSLGQAETNAAAMADATEYIRTAATLGTPYVRVMCESTAAPQSAVDEELVKRSLRELGALAASSGVTVLLETNGHYAKSERMAALFDEIGADGSAYCGTCTTPTVSSASRRSTRWDCSANGSGMCTSRIPLSAMERFVIKCWVRVLCQFQALCKV